MTRWLLLGATFFLIVAMCYDVSHPNFWPTMILANIWGVGATILQAIRLQNSKV